MKLQPPRLRGYPVPLALPLAAAAAGIVASLQFEVLFFWLTGTAVFFLVTLSLFLSSKLRSCAVYSLLLWMVFFFGLLFARQQRVEKDSFMHLVPARGELTGKSGYSVRKIIVDAQSFRSEGITWQTSGRTVVYYDGPPPPPGSRVKVTGSFYLPSSPVNPGQFDYGRYLAFEGIFTAARAEKIEVLREKFPGSLISAIRSFTSEKIELYFKSPYSTAILSMFLGDPARMPSGILEDFRRAGITHILAVSGLHVGLVLFIFYLLFSSPGLSRRRALLVSLAVMWLFIFVTGLRPSALRAGIMISFAGAGYVLGGRGNVFNGLAAAALFILVFRPGLLFTAGFQLSFLAVFGIIYLGPVLSSFLGKALGVSTAAVVFIIPVLAGSFHYLPLAAPLVNLAVIPLASVTMATVFLFLFLSAVFPAAAPVYASAGEFFTAGILKLAELTALSPVAGITSPAPSPLALAGLYLALASAGMLGAARRKAGLCAAAAVLLFSGVRTFYFPRRYVAAIVGADSPSFVVKAGREKPVLFAGRGEVNVQAVVNFIRNRGHTRLKHVYIVHPPFSGFESLAELALEVRPEKIFYPDEVGNPLGWEKFTEKVGRERVATARAGEIVQYRGWKFEFTEPDKKYLDLRDNYMQGIARGDGKVFVYAGGGIEKGKFEAVIVMDPYRPDWDKLKELAPLIIYSGKKPPEAVNWIKDKGEVFEF